MDAASGGAAVWWWIGIIVLFLVVIPLVLFLAQRLLTQVIEVKRYADDILEHGVAVTENLAPVPALAETRDLVREVGAGLASYAGALGRMR